MGTYARGQQIIMNDFFSNILSNAPGIALIIFVVLAAFFVLMRRSPFLILARAFRFITLPFTRLLRALRILPKAGGGVTTTAVSLLRSGPARSHAALSTRASTSPCERRHRLMASNLSVHCRTSTEVSSPEMHGRA